MLKKISTGSDVEKLKPGDYIFDNPEEKEAREYKIKKILFGYLLAFHGGDFPSLKIIRKKNLIAGEWWISSAR